MESSGAGAHAVLATPTPVPQSLNDVGPRTDFDNMTWTGLDEGGANHENTFLQSPLNDKFVPNPFQPSNVRGSIDESAANGAAQVTGQALDAPANFSTPKQEEPTVTDMVPPPLPFDASMESNNLDTVPMSQDPDRFYFDDDWSQPNLAQEPSQANSEPEKPDVAEMNGFAQLSFQDGEFLVTSTQIILGRDDKFARKYHQEQKLAKRRLKEGSRQAKEVEAQEALHQYQQEPSQPSAHGEDPSPIDSSLEGRPARGLASAYSEQGGIVGLPEDETRRRKRNKKRRNLLFSGQSSSTTSVAPANLHAFKYDISPAPDDDTEDLQKPVFLPVHPNNPADIKLISREHLHIGYNNQNSRWEMRILGRSAYVKNELYYVEAEGVDNWEDCEPKLLERDEVAVLTHLTEIIVASLRLQFRLPRNKVVSTFDSDSELSDALSSPERQLSTAQGGAESDLDSSDDDDAPLQSIKQKKSKKKSEDKGKSGQKPVTLKLKKRKDSDTSPSKAAPETPSKAEKGKKPKKTVAAGSEPQPQPEAPEKKDAPKQPMTLHLPPNPTQAQAQEQATQAQSQQQMQSQAQAQPPQSFESVPPETPASATPAAVYAPQAPSEPVHFEPGSMLSEVPMDQLPEKRKGPGRPPKNGLISKRDMGIIRRKQKEFEKQGIPVPPLDELVRIVRTENKAKEAAAKAAARGEAPPPAMAQSFPVMQSIEVSQEPSASQGPTYVPAVPTPVHTTMREGEYASADAEAKGSPKRPRTYRSPSPMKSKEECTEEELKKPNHTYYTTLDEILSEGPPEGLELQQIYDKICKKYPYYKYGVDGHGWQSSVRHNLKQHDRFQQVTKQGKGWLWAINQDIPFDKEKKRKPTPPPVQRPPMGYPMANGMAPQPGMQQYGNPYAYGQPMPNGQPQYQQPPAQPGQQYASPYGQPGQQQYAQPGAHPQYMPPGTQPPANQQYQYQPQQQQPPPPQHYQPNGAPPPQQTMPPRTTPTGQRQGSGTPHPQPGFSNLVDEIMAYRSNHLRPYAHLQQTPLYKEQEDVFKKCVEWISELQSNRTPQLNFANDQERRVFSDLERIMKKYQNNAPAPTPAPAQNAQQPGPTATSGAQAPPTSQPAAGPPGAPPANPPTAAPANVPVAGPPTAPAPAPGAAPATATASMGTSTAPSTSAPMAPTVTTSTSTADTSGVKRPAPESDVGDGANGGEAKRMKVEGDGIHATSMPATQASATAAGATALQQPPQTTQVANTAPATDNATSQSGTQPGEPVFDFSNPSGPQDPVFDFSTPDQPGANSSQPVFDFSDPTPAASVPAPVQQQPQPYNPPPTAQTPQPPQQQFSQPPQNPGTPQAPQPSPLYSQPPSQVASAAPTPQPTQAYSQPPSQPPSAAPTPQPTQHYQPPPHPQSHAATPQPTQQYQPPSQPQSHAPTPQPVQHYQPPPQPHNTAPTPRPVQQYQPPSQPQSGMATPQPGQQPSSHQPTPSQTPGPGPAASATPLSIEHAVETMLPVATSGHNTPTGSGTGGNNTPAPQS